MKKAVFGAAFFDFLAINNSGRKIENPRSI